MKSTVAAIFDSKVKIFTQPYLFVNKGAALRTWQEAANDPQSPYCKHPEDFTMFIVGEYNDETGILTHLTAFESLGNALQFKNIQQQNNVTNLHSEQQQ